MPSLLKHWARIAVTLVPLALALVHSLGLFEMGLVARLDNLIYDLRLRATLPRTMDERIVIVDFDEKSLAEVGRWPWSRDKLAALTDELFDTHKAAVVGFDVLFAEPDESSGLKQLRQLASGELQSHAAFGERVESLAPRLDYDRRFAKAMDGRPVVLGYYFTSDREGRTSGVLPAPVMDRRHFNGRYAQLYSWDGYGSNIDTLSKAAPLAGYFNAVSDTDGVLRSVPLVSMYSGRYYESLSLAMYRLVLGLPEVRPAFPGESGVRGGVQGMDRLLLVKGERAIAVPVDTHGAALVPYRGPGGPKGGSFRYVSATDILNKRIAPGSLSGKLILVATTAPGLQDLRNAPVGDAYPGVECHANLLSGLLDGRGPVRPYWSWQYDVTVVLLVGLLLAFVLPLLAAPLAIGLSALAAFGVLGLNSWLFLAYGWVLPMAAALLMVGVAFAVNMSWGYFVESRSKRELANLFGTYVPPELVDEMVKDPDSYSMAAANKELTVMFCDMRGFTQMSEKMEPTELQHLLNGVFNRLTDVIRAHSGTIDKYMGDCVMAFWGAPVDLPQHAQLAAQSAQAMAAAVHAINAQHRDRGLPEIGVGVGLNTGMMCVGDMGSDIRRSYTVIGDSVNLASRLEGLSKVYGVEIVASETTRRMAPGAVWQELDRVRVKGKAQAVAIYSPLVVGGEASPTQIEELKTWAGVLKAYRDQDWDRCDELLSRLHHAYPHKALYALYADRVSTMRMLPFDPEWDGATNFESK